MAPTTLISKFKRKCRGVAKWGHRFFREAESCHDKCRGGAQPGYWIRRKIPYTQRTYDNGAKIVSCEYLTTGQKCGGRCSLEGDQSWNLLDCPHHFIPSKYNIETLDPDDPLIRPK